MKKMIVTVLGLVLTTSAFAQNLNCSNKKHSLFVDTKFNKVVVKVGPAVQHQIKKIEITPESNLKSFTGDQSWQWLAFYTFQDSSNKLTLKYWESTRSSREISAQYTDAKGYPLTETMYCSEQ